jgi:hypothetical protein
MKEPYGKGLATRPGPESCARHGNMAGEALTGAHAGQRLRGEKGGRKGDTSNYLRFLGLPPVCVDSAWAECTAESTSPPVSCQ